MNEGREGGRLTEREGVKDMKTRRVKLRISLKLEM